MITTFIAFIIHLLFEGPAIRLTEIFASDQLFKSLHETESIEELKPKSSRSSSEDSVKKSTDKNDRTPASPEGDLA